MKLIIGAMSGELQIAIEKNNAQFLTSVCGSSIYKFDNTVIAITGIGLINSAIVLTKIISTYQIDVIINIGTAGGVKKDILLYDICLPETVYFLDFDVTAFGYDYGQIPHQPSFYKQTNNLVAKFKSLMPTAKSNCVLGSSSSFINDPVTFAPLFNKFDNKIDLVDMEGAAILYCAYQFNIPVLMIKIISDHLHNDTKSTIEFNNNLNQISNQINDLLDICQGVY